jgi:hypothetical protein
MPQVRVLPGAFPSDRHRAVDWKHAVGVAQLVELLVVVQVVAGSSPVAHLKHLQICHYEAEAARRADGEA